METHHGPVWPRHLTLPNLQFIYMFKNSVQTLQETHDVATTKISWLIMFKETITAYCDPHMEHINKLMTHIAPTHTMSRS